jgi:hypothetical protein
VSICVLFFNKNKWDTHNNNNDDDNNKPSRKIGRMRERERERKEDEKEDEEGKRTGNNFCVRPVIYSAVKSMEDERRNWKKGG